MVSNLPQSWLGPPSMVPCRGGTNTWYLNVPNFRTTRQATRTTKTWTRLLSWLQTSKKLHKCWYIFCQHSDPCHWDHGQCKGVMNSFFCTRFTSPVLWCLLQSFFIVHVVTKRMYYYFTMKSSLLRVHLSLHFKRWPRSGHCLNSALTVWKAHIVLYIQSMWTNLLKSCESVGYK